MTKSRLLRSGLLATLAAFAAAACTSSSSSSDAGITDRDAASDASRADDASSDAPVAPQDAATQSARYEVPECDNGVPLPVGGVHAGPHVYGRTFCATVGARGTSQGAEWPDVQNARRPLVYVRPGGTGDGSSTTSPMASITAALASLQAQGNGTIVLATGTFTVDASISVDTTIAILGNGPSSIIDFTTVSDGLTVSSAVGSLDVRDVQLNASVTSASRVFIVGPDASLSLNNVTVDHPESAVQSTGGHIDVANSTFLNGRGHVFDLAAGSDATIRGSLIQGGSHGIYASGASVDLSVVGIRDAGIGIVGIGTTSTTVTLDRVSIVGSLHVGIGLNGAGVVSTISQSLVGGTKFASAGDGIGVFATNGASVGFDPSIAADDRQGLGSMIIANQATGIVMTMMARGEIHGALLGSNSQSGLVVQNGAEVGNLAYSYLHDNVGAGLVVSTGGSIAGLLCNGVVANLRGVMRFASSIMTLQDGAVVSPGSSRFSLRIENTSFIGHQGFGLLCDGVDATMIGAKFLDNGIAWGIYNGATTSEALTTSDNAAEAPASNPEQAPGSVTQPQLR